MTFSYDWRNVRRPPNPEFLKGRLEYVIAVSEDQDLILDFLKNEYIPRNELNNAMSIPLDDSLARYKHLGTYLSQHATILGFLSNELVLVSINSVEDFPKNRYRYKPYSWKIRSDYEAETQTHNYKNYLRYLFKHKLESGLDQLIPDCKKLFRSELGCVKSNISK
uniref:Uncharacterized protein n=1 Tax=Acrobeloides nanus TaxID=290746 RepID=A0A914DW29_9BILA